MSDSSGGGEFGSGLSKYQEALKRLKGETVEPAPEFVDAPDFVEAEPSPESAQDSMTSFLDEIAEEHGLGTGPSAEPVPEPVSLEADAALPPATTPEPIEDSGMSFLDEIAAEHGLTTTPSGKAPVAEDENPPEESDDSMDRYLAKLNRLKTEKDAAEPTDSQVEAEDEEPTPAEALKAARGTLRDVAAPSEVESRESGEAANTRFQRAAERLKDRPSVQEPAKKKLRRVPALKGVLHDDEDCAPCTPAAARRKARAKAKSGAPGSPRKTVLTPLALKAGICLAVLATGLLLQFAVYRLLDTQFASMDLLAGCAAVLPVALVLALVTPENSREWLATMGGVAALGLAASLSFSLCLAAGVSEPLSEVHVIVLIFMQLGIVTLLLGPAILIVAGLLHRLELIQLTDPLYA